MISRPVVNAVGVVYRESITKYYSYMSRQTKVISLSFPAGLAKAMDTLSKQTAQTRSELMRSALHDYMLDMAQDRERFLEAYQATRGGTMISMGALRRKYGLV